MEQIVTRAGRGVLVSELVGAIGEVLGAHFGLAGYWAWVFADMPGGLDGGVDLHFAARIPLPTEAGLDDLGRRSAIRLWQSGTVGVVHHDRVDDVAAEDFTALQRHLAGHGLASSALIPLGVGDRCLGSMTLLRAVSAAAWTPAELTLLRDVGVVLSAALLSCRAGADPRPDPSPDDPTTRLLATATHDLANPLTAIRMSLGVLTSVDDPAAAAIARVAERNCERMRQILGSLTTLLSAGRRHHDEQVATVGLVRDVCERFAVIAEAHGVRLTARLPDPECWIAGSALELTRAVENLVGNAVKFTPAGGSVDVTVTAGHDEILVEVSDTGPGIDAEDRERIFEAFYRARRTTGQGHPGTGLGLAIVSSVARGHGGSVRVRQRPGGGSVFELVLPRRGADAD